MKWQWRIFTVGSLVAVLAMVVTSCAPTSAPTPTIAAPTATARVAASPTSAPTQASPTAVRATATPIPTIVPIVPTPPQVGPSPTPPPSLGGILRVGHHADPVNVDPNLTGSGQTTSLTSPEYSFLVRWIGGTPPGVNDVLVGDLAETWQVSGDGTVITFKLRPNVKWHDGRPMTVEDVKWGLELMGKPPAGYLSGGRSLFLNTDRFEAVDASTLRVVLKRPAAGLFAELGDNRHAILPKHVADAEGLDVFKTKVIGTGPFKFKSYNRGSSWEVVKNPDYYLPGRPYLDGIKWFIIPDRDTRFAALRTGQIHMSPPFSQGLSAPQGQTVETQLSKDLRVIRYPAGIGIGLIFNVQKEPVNDVRVRRAISLAMERREFIDIVEQGGAHLSTDLPPSFWGTPLEELVKQPGYRQPKDQDIAEAKRLLAEAGYPNGFTLPMISWDRDPFYRAPVVAQQQLAKIGIKVEIKILDTAQVTQLTNRGDFVVNSGVPLNTAQNDPDALFGGYHRDGASNYGFSDPLVTELLEKQSATQDLGERKKLVRQIEARLLDLAPRVVWYEIDYVRGLRNEVRGHVEGYGPYRGMKFDTVWLSK